MPAQHTASTPPLRGHPLHRHKRKEASGTKPGTVVETTISSHVKDNKRNLQKKKPRMTSLARQTLGISFATVTSSRTNSDGMLSKYSQFRTCLLNKQCFIHSFQGFHRRARCLLLGESQFCQSRFHGTWEHAPRGNMELGNTHCVEIHLHGNIHMELGNTHRVEIHFHGTLGTRTAWKYLRGKCNSMRTSTMYGKAKFQNHFELFPTTVNNFTE